MKVMNAFKTEGRVVLSFLISWLDFFDFWCFACEDAHICICLDSMASYDSSYDASANEVFLLCSQAKAPQFIFVHLKAADTMFSDRRLTLR